MGGLATNAFACSRYRRAHPGTGHPSGTMGWETLVIPRGKPKQEAEFQWNTGTAKITIDGKTVQTAKLYPEKQNPKSRVLADFDMGNNQTCTAFVGFIWWDVCEQWSASGSNVDVFRSWKIKPRGVPKSYRAKRAGPRAVAQAALTSAANKDPFVLLATYHSGCADVCVGLCVCVCMFGPACCISCRNMHTWFVELLRPVGAVTT